MWADALRIVKEYLPHKLDDFQKEMSSNSGEYVLDSLLSPAPDTPLPLPLPPRNYEELLSQGHLWEQNGEHTHAIDVYLQLNTKNCPDHSLLQEYWEKVR